VFTGGSFPRRETYHSPQSSPPYVFMAWYLIKHGVHLHCIILI